MVVVTANDIAKMIVPSDPGVYIVGTGSSGASETFLFLGLVYFLVMTAALFPTGFLGNSKPKGWTPPKETKKSMITQNHVILIRH